MQQNFTRDQALEILDALVALNVNVTLVAIADPMYGGGTPDMLPVYQLDLSRNSNIPPGRIMDISAALEPNDATLQIPAMAIVSTLPEEEPSQPVAPDPVPGPAQMQAQGPAQPQRAE